MFQEDSNGFGFTLKQNQFHLKFVKHFDLDHKHGKTNHPSCG